MSLPGRASTGTVSAMNPTQTSVILTTPTEATMDARCGCGDDIPSELALFGCFDCGTTCCRACTIHLESATYCRACTIHLESATYCRACAGSLLDTAAVQAAAPFELH